MEKSEAGLIFIVLAITVIWTIGKVIYVYFRYGRARRVKGCKEIDLSSIETVDPPLFVSQLFTNNFNVYLEDNRKNKVVLSYFYQTYPKVIEAEMDSFRDRIFHGKTKEEIKRELEENFVYVKAIIEDEEYNKKAISGEDLIGSENKTKEMEIEKRIQNIGVKNWMTGKLMFSKPENLIAILLDFLRKRYIWIRESMGEIQIEKQADIMNMKEGREKLLLESFFSKQSVITLTQLKQNLTKEQKDALNLYFFIEKVPKVCEEYKIAKRKMYNLMKSGFFYFFFPFPVAIVMNVFGPVIGNEGFRIGVNLFLGINLLLSPLRLIVGGKIPKIGKYEPDYQSWSRVSKSLKKVKVEEYSISRLEILFVYAGAMGRGQEFISKIFKQENMEISMNGFLGMRSVEEYVLFEENVKKFVTELNS